MPLEKINRQEPLKRCVQQGTGTKQAWDDRRRHGELEGKAEQPHTHMSLLWAPSIPMVQAGSGVRAHTVLLGLQVGFIPDPSEDVSAWSQPYATSTRCGDLYKPSSVPKCDTWLSLSGEVQNTKQCNRQTRESKNQIREVLQGGFVLLLGLSTELCKNTGVGGERERHQSRRAPQAHPSAFPHCSPLHLSLLHHYQEQNKGDGGPSCPASLQAGSLWLQVVVFGASQPESVGPGLGTATATVVRRTCSIPTPQSCCVTPPQPLAAVTTGPVFIPAPEAAAPSAKVKSSM